MGVAGAWVWVGRWCRKEDFGGGWAEGVVVGLCCRERSVQWGWWVVGVVSVGLAAARGCVGVGRGLDADGVGLVAAGA